MKKLILLSFLLALTTFLTVPGLATVHNVTVQDFSFDPANLTIEQGDTVIWTNILGFHSVHHTGTPSEFGTPAGPAPWVYEYAFDDEEPGDYPYICEVHPTLMMGVITVAGPCEAPEPPAQIDVGTSACIQVCPGEFITLILQGDVEGPTGTPVLVLQAGCQTLNCDVECTPIDPPDTLVYGSNPFYPDEYFGKSDCIQIIMHWVHDGVWEFDIFSACEGCFCVTFDRQLAVKLQSFDAITGNQQIELRWSTASEVDNDYFEIRRDGATVTEVDAAGSPTGAHYSWIDRGLENGTTYHYVLVAVDVSGNREEIGGVNGTPVGPATQVTAYALHQNYPNPFNAQTSIAFDLVESGPVKLSLYDLMGREIVTLVNQTMDAGNHNISFDAGRLPSGMYLYRLDASNFTTQKKMLLLK